MKEFKTRRVLSILLITALFFSQTGLTALAVESNYAGELCPHHTEHTPKCGYSEGADCTHEHTPECYAAEPICGLVEDEGGEVTDSDAPHTHTQDCYALDCAHVHDEACGYAEETLCGFDSAACEICNPKNSGNQDGTQTQCVCVQALCTESLINSACPVCGAEGADLADCEGKDSGDVPLGVSSITVTAFDPLAGDVQQQAVPVGTVLEDLNLPKTLTATGYEVTKDTQTQNSGVMDSGTPFDALPEPMPITIEGVTWELDPEHEVNAGNNTYNAESGSYAFTPVLPESHTLAEGIALPEICVMVGGMNLLLGTAVEYGDFSVTTENGTTPTYGSNILILGSGTYTVSMNSGVTSTSTSKIVVSSGVTANITLNGVDIQLSADNACAFELQDTAKVNLTLAAGSVNTLKSGNNRAGLQVQDENTAAITIDGTGSLNAAGGKYGAGIGGGRARSGSNITINGGTVTAIGGYQGAGIGGGRARSGGIITINGGTVTSRGGIGGGGGEEGGGSGGNITITGGTVMSWGGIGGGSGETAVGSGGNITITGGMVTSQGGIGGDGSGTFSTGDNGGAVIVTKSISDQSGKTNNLWSGVIFEGIYGVVYKNPTIPQKAEIPVGYVLTVTADKSVTFNGTVVNNGLVIVFGTLTASYWKNEGSCTVMQMNNGKIEGLSQSQYTSVEDYAACGDLLVKNGTVNSDYSYDADTHTVTILNNTSLTFAGISASDRIVVPTGVTANITFNNVYIDVSKIENACALELQGTATVNLTLLGDSTLRSGVYCAGLQVQNKDNCIATLTVSGTGSLNAIGGGWGAGIGSGRNTSGGIITINSGTVRAQGGDDGAGIGGGFDTGGRPGGGTITINGGIVLATPSGRAAAIGGGAGYSGSNTDVTITGGIVTANGTIGAGFWDNGSGQPGTFTTGTDGKAVIIANHISAQTGKNEGKWSGMIFEGNSGNIYGNPTLTMDAEIPQGKTLTVESGKTLTIGTGVILTNRGTIVNNGTIVNKGTIDNRGTITNDGTITNNGTFNNYGTISGNTPSGGTVNNPSQVAVTFSKSGSSVATVTYGDTITITAAVGGRRMRSVSPDLVDFYLGSVDAENKLNSNPINVENSSAELTVTLDGDVWAKGFQIGNNFIIADFSGSTSDKLVDSGGWNTLKVTKAMPSINTLPTATAITYGQALLNSALSNGEASVTGSFAWTDNSLKPSASDSGGTGYSVTFTPTDTEHYETITANIKITVTTATLIPSLSVSNVTKVYDGDTDVEGAVQPTVNLSGVVNGENPMVTATFAYADANAGTNKTINATVSLKSDAVSTNYTLSTAALSASGATITNAGQNQPIVNAVNETVVGKNDGKITGTTTEMEYSTDQSFAATTTCGGTETTGLAPNTYYVRYKAKTNYNAGAAATVIIAPGAEKTYTLEVAAPTFTAQTYGYSQPSAAAITITSSGNSDATISGVTVSGDKFTISGSGDTVAAGGSINTWTVQPKTSLDAGTHTATVTVTYNSTTATATVSFTVTQATPAAPATPTQPNGIVTTHNSITISTVSGQKYICTTASSTPPINGGTGWAGGTGSPHTFGSLNRNTQYYIWTYAPESSNYTVSAVSSSLSVTTAKEPITSVNVLGITPPAAKAAPDTDAQNGTGWTAGEVTWYKGSESHSSAFDYSTAYTVKVTLTAAAGYEFPTSVAALIGGQTATVQKESNGTLTVSYTYPATSAQGQTAAPAFANAANSMQTATAAAANFTLTNKTGNYQLYSLQTGGTAGVSGVSIGVDNNILTLTFTTAPLSDVTYYVSATDTSGDLTESPRTAITVKAYVATTGVSINKSTLGLKVGGKETLTATITPDAATNKTAAWVSSDATIATVDGSGKVTAIKAGTAAITATAADGQTAACAVTVTRPSSGGGDDTPTYTPPTVVTPPAAPEQPNPPINGSATLPGKPDKDGNVNVIVPNQNITGAISAAKKQAGQNGISVTVKVNITQTANSLTATLSKAALDKLVAEGVKELKIKSSLISFSFNLEALKEIQKSVTGNLTITAKKQDVTKLSKAAQTAIGNRPVFGLTIQSGGKAITGFGKGGASVWMPYTPVRNEAGGSLQAVYVYGNGAVQWITGSSYNKDAKVLLFTTNHFSVYGIGYKASAPVFTDITGHWAKDDIEFAAARGLFSGSGNNQFNPSGSMTRGMFVTALGRLAGIDPAKYTNTKFTDVKADAYYAPYTVWAAEKGITTGTGATTFSPDQSITRQEMAVFMQNYAKAMGYTLPKTREAITFADSASIGSWAAEAVKAMQMAGIINGKDGNRFDPTGTATRAEVSAVLRRYVEMVIDSATAQGISVNDSGSAMLYEGGKLVKSASRTVNNSTYAFNSNGEAALPPKNLGHITHIVQKNENWGLIAQKYGCSVSALAKANNKTIFNVIHPGDLLRVPMAQTA